MTSIEPGDINIKSISDDYIVVSTDVTAGPDALRNRLLSAQARNSQRPMYHLMSLPLLIAHNHRHKAQPDSTYVSVCVIKYNVKFSSKEAGYVNGEIAYAEVSAQLASAVADKSFDAFVHEYALIYTERSLQDVNTPDSSDALYSTYTVKDHDATDDNSSDTKSGQSQGLSPTGVALVVLFTALTVLGCVFCWGNRGKIARGRYAELGSESTHDLTGVTSTQVGQEPSPPRSSQPSLARMAASSVFGRKILRSGSAKGSRGAKGRSKGGDDDSHRKHGAGAGQGRGGHTFIIEEVDDDDEGEGGGEATHDEETGGSHRQQAAAKHPPHKHVSPRSRQVSKHQGKQSHRREQQHAAAEGDVELAEVSHNPIVATQEDSHAV
jgi:hypothetical protein